MIFNAQILLNLPPFVLSVVLWLSISDISSRSSMSKLQVSQDYFYLVREQLGQALERRLELTPTPSKDEEDQAPPYPPTSTDENNGQRPDEPHAIPRKPVATVSSLVKWNGPQDPQNPMNWPPRQKNIIVAAVCCISFSASFSSSVFAPAVLAVAAEYGVNEEVGILGISLYVLGFAAGNHNPQLWSSVVLTQVQGPLLWGPLSEAYGRTQPLFFAYSFFVIMQIPVAVAQNLTAVLLCRFLAGAFGSAVFAIPSALAVDFLNPIERSKAVGLYITFLFLGPATGPIVGSYLTTSLGWRWTAWIGVLVGGLSDIFALLVIPESSEAVILQRKAARLRSQTQNWALHSKADESPVTFASLRTKYLLRPVQMIMREPIVSISPLRQAQY
jgi:DHA1 family multidrug resistance protein-like MFS transporter